MTFDFSAYHSPPSGFMVLQKDRVCLRVHHIRSNTQFRVTGNGKGTFVCEVRTGLDETWQHLTTQYSLYDMFHHIGLLSSWHTLVRRARKLGPGSTSPDYDGQKERDLFNGEE